MPLTHLSRNVVNLLAFRQSSVPRLSSERDVAHLGGLAVIAGLPELAESLMVEIKPFSQCIPRSERVSVRGIGEVDEVLRGAADRLGVGGRAGFGRERKGRFTVGLVLLWRAIDVYLSRLGGAGFIGHGSRKEDHYGDYGRSEAREVRDGEEDIGPEPAYKRGTRNARAKEKGLHSR